MDKRLTSISDPSIITATENCTDVYCRLFNCMYDGVGLFEVCGNKLKALYLNERYFEIVGYTKDQYLPYLDNITVTLLEDDEQRLFEQVGKCLDDGTDFNCEVRGYRFNGTVGWFCVRARRLDFIKNDNPVFMAAVTDTSKQKELEHQLNINRERYRILEETGSAFLFEYKPFSDTMIFSPGKSRSDFVIENYSTYLRREDYLHPYDVNYFFNVLYKACRKVCRGFVDIRTLNYEKTDYILCRIYYSAIADKYGAIISVVGRIEKISEDSGFSPRLISETEGSNVCLLECADTAIEKIINTIHSNTNIGYLVIADIDNLTNINEKYGPEIGNDVIKMAADLLTEVFENAIAFRYMGDEFVLYIEDVTENQLYDMFERLNIAAETMAITLPDGTVETMGMTFSAGAAWAHNGTGKISVKDYFITADKVLYKAKTDGKNRMYIEKIIY